VVEQLAQIALHPDRQSWQALTQIIAQGLTSARIAQDVA
jgi:hypothetical protein